MRRFPGSTRMACALAVLAGLLPAYSCNKRPTEPAPRATVHRTVTLIVRDSLGSPVANAAVSWIADFDSAGLVEIRPDVSGADGTSLQVLAEGPWMVTAEATSPFVAGASFRVSGPERTLADTQAVRITLHTGSSVSGLTTLAGRSDHAGTIVTSEIGGIASTDAAGAWALENLPLGRWTVTMFHFGFKIGIAQVEVVTPGSHVVVPPVALISDP